MSSIESQESRGVDAPVNPYRLSGLKPLLCSLDGKWQEPFRTFYDMKEWRASACRPLRSTINQIPPACDARYQIQASYDGLTYTVIVLFLIQLRFYEDVASMGTKVERYFCRAGLYCTWK
jgi:hypothetical protein